MEIVIPPRDHGPSTYKYEWDENGEVVSTQRVGESAADSSGRGRERGRQTVQWPFQSIATEASVSTPTFPQFAFRRATWQPRGLLRDSSGDDASSATAPFDRSIIPDYVVNYIRGETPESVARRKRNGGRIAERDVDVEQGLGRHQHQQSRVAEFEGFDFDGGSSARTRVTNLTSAPSSRDGTARQMLASSDETKGGRRRRRRGRNGSRGLRRLTHGWRAGVALNALLAFIALAAGLVCLVLAVYRAPRMLAGEAVVFAGSCGAASGVSWALHALVSTAAFVLVAGANYVFQVLSSPTRAELAAAHAGRRWLDIGIPSVRNFAFISRGRVVLCIAVLATAVATQVIYNSVIFTSFSDVDYSVLFIAPSFLAGAPFSNASSNNAGGLSRIEILGLQDLAGRHELVNLTTDSCLQEFGGAFDTDFEAVLLVTGAGSVSNSLIQTGASGARLVAQGSGASEQSSTQPPVLVVDPSDVSFCLAQPRDGEPTCDVSLSASLLAIVALLNLIAVILAAAALFKMRFEPIVTLGDAITSFLRDPDPTTEGACLMSKTDVWQGRWGLAEAKYWVPRDHYWFGTPSLPRWAVGVLIWVALAGLAAAALGVTTHTDPAGGLGSFGEVSPHAVYVFPPSAPAGAAVLVAGLPQILLAALYLATNSHMSAYFLSHESSRYALGQGLPLRVSASPEGAQTTSLYLTLPRPWSWLLLTLFAAMGFVLSQSVLVVGVRSTDDSPTRLVALGFSGTGLLILLALLVVLAVVVLGLGFRRAPPAVTVNGEAVGNPLVFPAGTCSAVISARCHPSHAVPAETDMWVYPVAWGVVHLDEAINVAHCTFSSRHVAQLDISRSYA